MRFIAILVGVLVGCFPVIGASKGYQEYGDGLTETAEIRIGHLLSNPVFDGIKSRASRAVG